MIKHKNELGLLRKPTFCFLKKYRELFLTIMKTPSLIRKIHSQGLKVHVCELPQHIIRIAQNVKKSKNDFRFVNKYLILHRATIAKRQGNRDRTSEQEREKPKGSNQGAKARKGIGGENVPTFFNAYIHIGISVSVTDQS